MIRKVACFVFSTTLSVSAISCELPKGESIEVGCTYECDFFYRARLMLTAWGMGYSVKIQTLSGDVDQALSSVDAVLVPGGADIDPKYYLQSVTPELQEYTKKNLNLVSFTKEGERRDPFEYSVVKNYSENPRYSKLPMLGVCRGFQMMSVAQGIPLYLDIKTEVKIKNRRYLFDKVSIDTNSSLFKSLYKKTGTIKGYKMHHQGIRVPYYLEHKADYPEVKVTAFSNDRKIAEAMEYIHRPALGVQFHPEKSFPKTSTPIFKWLLNKACEYKASHKDLQ